MKIDLHLHSNMSDGIYPPEEVIKKAEADGLEVISITDHDVYSGNGKLGGYYQSACIKIIHGVELSASYNEEEVHILGYFRNGISERFKRFLSQAQTNRNERITTGLKNLKEQGVDITYEDLMKLSQEGSIGRSHLARLLVARGYADSPFQAFQKYLKYDREIVPRTKTKAKEGIEAIRESDGITIWAHPSLHLFDKFLKPFIDFGLQGIEAYNRKKNKNNSFYFHTAGEKLGLFITAGSDWHGLENETFLSQEQYPYKIIERFIGCFQ